MKNSISFKEFISTRDQYEETLEIYMVDIKFEPDQLLIIDYYNTDLKCYKFILHVYEINDIIDNLNQQISKPIGLKMILKAIKFYYYNDAFLIIDT